MSDDGRGRWLGSPSVDSNEIYRRANRLGGISSSLTPGADEVAHKKRGVKVIHNAPGKKGKQEVRVFKTADEALAYIERNTREGRFPGRLAR
jgi:hypothetical protein